MRKHIQHFEWENLFSSTGGDGLHREFIAALDSPVTREELTFPDFP